MAYGTSPAVLEALARRSAHRPFRTARIEWYINQVNTRLDISARQKMFIATEYLKSKIIKNISIPVTKTRISHTVSGGGVRWTTIVTDRSKPGEFPRADTTLLMKTIFSDVVKLPNGTFEGHVGTPLDYGFFLETRMQRSFLWRTLREEAGQLSRILGAPIKT